MSRSRDKYGHLENTDQIRNVSASVRPARFKEQLEFCVHTDPWRTHPAHHLHAQRSIVACVRDDTVCASI